jgi:hypothetical protein
MARKSKSLVERGSNRDNGFRFSVYCDMLFNWPDGLRVSGENANVSIAQISAGYMNMNLVAFYFVKAKTLFLFYGETLGLANRCRVFHDVAAVSIQKVLNDFMGGDFGWLVTVTGPLNSGPCVGETQAIRQPGMQLSFMCNVGYRANAHNRASVSATALPCLPSRH